MAHIVLIHGISHQYESADQLETEWIPAIAGGVRNAGFAMIADSIMGKKIEIRMAFYGQRFRTQAQGVGRDIAALQSDLLVESLAVEWLERAESSTDEKVRRSAMLERRGLLQSRNASQGIGNVMRSATSALARVPLLADLGMGFAQNFLYTALKQVSKYFEDAKLRMLIIEDVAALVDNRTAVLIGHSLGSIVAFEIAHRLNNDIRLLTTLGSPIGLRNIVFDRLVPKPPTFPPRVQTWINVADKDDFVAAVSDLGPLFQVSSRPSAKFENHIVSNGARPHDVRPYLSSTAVGVALAKALS